MRRRSKLTRAELVEYKRLAERLRAAGGDLSMENFEVRCDRLLIRQLPELGASFVRTSAHRSIFVLGVSIVGLAPKTIVQNFDLSSTEWEISACLLVDPKVHNSKRELYYLPDHTTFRRDEVLNHHIGPEGILRRGDQMEGVILAEALHPVPALYKTAGMMEVLLDIEDQFGDWHSAHINLHVEYWRDPLSTSSDDARAVPDPCAPFSEEKSRVTT